MKNLFSPKQSELIKNIVLVLLSTAASLILSLTIAETFFFDKFFYQKSLIYGYDKNERNLVKQSQISPFLEARIEQLNKTLHVYSQNENKVLGTNTDQKTNIAVIGDSIAYGLGVKTEERFGDYLNNLFHTQNIDVSTLAQPGDSLLDHYAKMKIAKSTINPDIFVVTLVANDLLFDSKDKYPLSLETFYQIKNKCSAEEFIYKWPNLPPEKWFEVITVGISKSYDDQYANTCYAKELLSMMNNDFSNVIFIPVDEYRTKDELNEYSPEFEIIQSRAMEKLIDIVKKSGGNVIEPKALLSNYKFQTVSASESHPSKYTHQQFANILYLYLNNHLSTASKTN